MKDYYETLQISPSASEEVIRAAYKAMAKLYHPDTTKYDKVTAEQRMKEINEAFQVLSDRQKRKDYDARYRTGAGSAYRNQPPPDRETSDAEQPREPQRSASARQESPPPEQPDIRPKGRLFHFLSSIGKSISEQMQKNTQIRENAYLEGMNLPEMQLAMAFRKSTGYMRVGYGHALEERGLLERNADGKLVPTQEFLHYWR